MKNLLIDYFKFSKSQQRSILVLLMMIVSVSLCYFMAPSWMQSNTMPPTHTLESLMAQIEIDTMHEGRAYAGSVLTPFSFDPNTLDEAGFKKLGLREKLVSTILHYREKGGKFYNNESLKRIYGLHDDEYQQLEPYIHIANTERNTYQQKFREVLSIELNTADTTQLIKLPGIGSKLSMNIIRLRDQLGGFDNVRQMTEVYGLSAETFKQIKGSLHVNKSLIKTLNLNAATLYELNAHPYLHGEIARALVDYRKTHNYKIVNLNQIKEIALINDEIFRKIVPYLRLQ